MSNVFSGVVKDISSEGLGVVIHPEGLTYFVPGAWPGDAGEFIITQKEKRYGFARWHKQEIFSEDRQDVPCAHLGFTEGTCGGCPWMIVKYDRQLHYKHKMLQRHFLYYKMDTEILPVHPSQTEWGYRNRAQIKVNGREIGYVSPKTRQLAPIEDCIILNDKVRGLLKKVHQELPNKDWEPVGKHRWNFIDMDDDCQYEDLALNKRRPFKQANASANLYMRQWLERQIAGLEASLPVLELFCGSGNFTEILSAKFQNIIACEVKGGATEALRQKKWPGVQVLEADIFAKIQWGHILEKAAATKVLFMDPPREGFPDAHQFIEKLKNLEKIIYISCNPKTFLGDVRLLVNQGWEIKPVQPVDQFPHTPHLEILCVLEKRAEKHLRS